MRVEIPVLKTVLNINNDYSYVCIIINRVLEIEGNGQRYQVLPI